MRFYHMTIIFIILNSCSIAQLSSYADIAEEIPRDLVCKGYKLRRILHEPLLPAASPPPPVIESSPLPRPPPAEQDGPFFPAVPGGSIPDQPRQSPQANGLPVSNDSIATEQAQQPKPIKKVAIAISVGIVTLGMLSALAFYLFKHRVNQPREPQKLVGNNNSQRRINEESGLQPSSFLYIGTVEQSNQEPVDGNNGTEDGSMNRKSSTAKVSDRYRPSPDLQPLPPLRKPPPGPHINSPPPMSSSSDDESYDSNAFYTPRGMSVSSEDGFYTSIRQQSYRGNRGNTNIVLVHQSEDERTSSGPAPHSKKTSPHSRLVAPSPNVKPTMIPSIQQPPGLPPLPPRQLVDSLEAESLEPHEQGSDLALPFVARRLKLSGPPPPPDMTRFLSTNNKSQQPSKIRVPTPPPPPPPPPLSKLGVEKVNVNSEMSQKGQKEQSTDNPNPRTTPENSKQQIDKEVIDEASSSDIHLVSDADGSRPKLKPLHWDKVKASSDRATVWDQLKSSSFQLNEDMMDSLFIVNSTDSVKIKNTNKHGIPSGEKEIRLLDPKKSQNIAIFLRALNVSQDEVSEALLKGNQDRLGLELLETLAKMAPTKEEEIKLRDYSGDISKLGSAERFLKAILDVPFAFTRVEAMLYRKNFDTEVRYLRDSYNTLEEACRELKNSRLFLKVLEAVLQTGNRMNVGTMRGDARAFKLDTLLKLVDIKGTDGTTTLLHFVVQEMIRSEQTSCNPPNEALPSITNIKVREEVFKKEGLQIVSGLAEELSNIKKAAGMDSDVLHGYLTKLNTGLHKVKTVIQYEKQSLSGKFFESTKMFVEESEQEILRIKAEEQKAMSTVREVTEYFHGDGAKEEAHPFRIFMIVRDFLSILENVCREVGRMQERTIVGSARSFNLNAYR